MSQEKGVTFTEVCRDGGTSARAGILTLNGHTLETPILWLGHNLRGGAVRLWKEQGACVPGLLVNAFQLLKKPLLSRTVQESGIKDYLGFNRALLMDSGGYLFQKNARMTVCATRIAEVYRDAEIDIGVALDHPLHPSLPSSQNGARWKRTLRNTELMVATATSYAFMPVVHGYTSRKLKNACREIRRIVGDATIIGIGSLVPLMKGHLANGGQCRGAANADRDHAQFIADALKIVRDEFPRSFLHVFGVGGINTVVSLFALGADSVDSVAWRIKAAYGAIQLPGISDRFLSARSGTQKTRKVLGEQEAEVLADCRCPVCSQYDSVDWRKRQLDGSFTSRTIHNGWTFLQEVRSFRAALLTESGAAFLGKRLSTSHYFFRLLGHHREERGS
jgi:tRNA-guanine family transglycosylase